MKTQGQMASGEFYQTFREELTLTLLKLFQKTAEERTLSRSFYKIIITLIAKQDKDITQNNYRLMSLMNTDTKIFNKMLANQLQH